MDETKPVVTGEHRRFEWRKAVGRGIQVGAIIAGVNGARDTDWPTFAIVLLVAAGIGFGEAIRES